MNKKIAVVTGASRGVGKAVALHLAKINYFVILIARDPNTLKSVHNQIVADGDDAAYIPIDVADIDQVRTTIDNIVAEHGKIDLLFNNAAILTRGTTEIDDDEIKHLIDINLNGAIYVAKHVANQMKTQRSGYIINVSSSGGKVAMSFSGAYAASKFGLCGFGEALAKEMSAYGVKVTTLCPSAIATEMAIGRKFSLEQMIQIDDLIKTVDYILFLSPNAVPIELTLSCLPLIANMTKVIHDMYLS